MTITHPCKYCGIDCVMHNCDQDGIKAFSMLRLLPQVACEKCVKYRKGRFYVLRNIEKTAVKLMHVQYLREAKAKSLHGDLSAALRRLFEHFGRVICQHERIDLIDGEEFVEEIIRNPDKVLLIAKLYESAIEIEAKKRHAKLL